MSQHLPSRNLLILLPLLFSHTLLAQPCPLVLDPPTPRIIGGVEAPLQTRSFIAALFRPNDTFACTASLLSPRWLLTAAHCKVTPAWLVRVAGSRASDGTPVRIRRVFVHDAYRRDVVDAPGDIALIQLADPLPRTASFVTINSNASIPVPGSFARTAGYGRTQPNVQESNPPAYQVDAPVNSPIKCRDLYSATLNIRALYFICVGYGTSGCQANSCKGDSGGPLFQFDRDGNPIQIGIVAFGMNCGEQGVPGVYVKLSAFVDWIASRGAEFTTSASAISVFSDGSEEAASDDVATVLQAEQDSDSDTLEVSRVWFIVICVIAGIAIIALIFMSLVYVSGFRRARNSTTRTGSSTRASGYDRENLQLAISILQRMANAENNNSDRPPDSAHFSEASRDPPTAGADIIIDEVTPRGRHAVNRLHPHPAHNMKR